MSSLVFGREITAAFLDRRHFTPCYGDRSKPITARETDFLSLTLYGVNYFVACSFFSSSIAAAGSPAA